MQAISFDSRPDRRTEGVTKKYPTVITSSFCNYTLRKCPVRRQKFIRAPRILTHEAHKSASRHCFHLRFSTHFIYLRIINAHLTLILIKNAKILHDTFVSYLSIIFVMHIVLGFIISIVLGLTIYNKTSIRKYEKR